MNFGDPQNFLINPIVDECEIILQENESIGKKIENLEKELATAKAQQEKYHNILLEFLKIPLDQKLEKKETDIIEMIDNLKTDQVKIMNFIKELKDKQESSKQILRLAKSLLFLQKMYENKIKETEENKKKVEKELKIKAWIIGIFVVIFHIISFFVAWKRSEEARDISGKEDQYWISLAVYANEIQILIQAAIALVSGAIAAGIWIMWKKKYGV